ncbi:hypothetical protein OEB99_12720 [Actinotalea sp. M2MS4P-6]|uniref:hypothetical protein n=1 Tax=Actinotalea sp. M2MS4P-6 TaxID=2983762 RepID=UPI0021E3977D|nr:hypothetical protein [Actinotalea sp. M2MS4P-6]MCV2395173.1 hypothetical protein [Actinotalea sp. M2MS4P-6]
MVRRIRVVGLVALPVTLVVAATAGCAALGTQGATCVDWVMYESPADAEADAGLVVRTTGPAASTGTVALFGVAAEVHSVDVVDVLKGSEVTAGDSLEVVSAPETCTGEGPYPDGDPLDAAGPLILVLHWDADAAAWRTITPYQGVVPPADDGTLPEQWPAG